MSQGSYLVYGNSIYMLVESNIFHKFSFNTSETFEFSLFRRWIESWPWLQWGAEVEGESLHSLPVGGGGSRRRHLHVKLSMKILYSMKGSNVLEKNKIKILRVQILMTGYLLALLLLCVIKIVSCVRKILMV